MKSKDEVGRLAVAFNQMAEDVEKHQRSAVEQERIKRELELGRQIQAEMLPHAPLRLGLTEIKGVSVPAREVGGDFFNYFQVANGEVALLVGDVSGRASARRSSWRTSRRRSARVSRWARISQPSPGRSTAISRRTRRDRSTPPCSSAF